MSKILTISLLGISAAAAAFILLNPQTQEQKVESVGSGGSSGSYSQPVLESVPTDTGDTYVYNIESPTFVLPEQQVSEVVNEPITSKKSYISDSNNSNSSNPQIAVTTSDVVYKADLTENTPLSTNPLTPAATNTLNAIFSTSPKNQQKEPEVIPFVKKEDTTNPFINPNYNPQPVSIIY